MPKVGILSAVDLSRMTMASVYTDYLEANGISYDIIYVDKYKDDSPFKADNYYAYHVNGFEHAAFPKKMFHYWNMRGFVREQLKNNRYDYLIVWGEFTVFLFADILAKEMPKKYCINIRDYFYNNVFFVQHRLKIAIRNSDFFTVSSDAYLKYLPKGDSLVLHSLNHKVLGQLKPVMQLRPKGEPLRMMYIGLIARLPYVFKMIDELGNDDRFELIFAGIGSEEIDRYIEGKLIHNVKTFGRFPSADTFKYLQQADILYNLYGYHDRHFDTALSIKLYYAISMNIPIMVFDGTYTKEVAEQCGIAFVMHGEEYANLGDRLYKEYYSRNPEETERKCSSYLQKAEKSQQDLKERFETIFK